MSARMRDWLGSLVMLLFLGSLWVQRDYMSPLGGLFPDTMMAIMAVFVALSVILSLWPRAGRPVVLPIADSGEATPEAGPVGGEAGDTSAAAAPDGTDGIDWARLRTVLGVALLLILWVGLYRRVGFALTGTLGFGAIALYLDERGQWVRRAVQALAIGAATSFVIWLVFDYFLKVPLPPGFLFD